MRSAKVIRNSDGTPLGIPLFLNTDELDQFSVDPEEADQIHYEVVDGCLRLATDIDDFVGE